MTIDELRPGVPASGAAGVRVRRLGPCDSGPCDSGPCDSGRLDTLLLHGLGGGADIWSQCTPGLCEELTPWAAELPWHGTAGSAWAIDPDPVRWIDEAVEATLTTAGRRPGLLIAHSFAATLLLDRMSRGNLPGCAGVVLISPFFRSASKSFDWETISYYFNDFHLLLQEGIRVRPRARREPEIERAMALRVRELLGPYGWVRFFEAYLRTPGLCLAAITTPVLVVTGDRDFAAPPADGADLVCRLPLAKLEALGECGHFPMIERPDGLVRAIREFSTAITKESEA